MSSGQQYSTLLADSSLPALDRDLLATARDADCAVVVIDDDHLVIQPYWPVRRRIPWYRMDHSEVMPGSWRLLIEMNSGERFELPCVDGVDRLYEEVESHRKALDKA